MSERPGATAKESGARRRWSLRGVAIQVGFILLLLLIWQGIVSTGWTPEYLFPGPIAVFRRLIEMAQEGILWQSIRFSMTRMAIGYGISVVGGLTIGVISAGSQLFRQTFGTLILSLQGLPSICWLPLALIWVGLNERAVMLVVVLGSVFSIAIATEGAIRNIPPIYYKVGRVLGAKGAVLARDVLFFAALPEIMGGLKLGWSFAWRSLMAAELIRQDLIGVGHLLETGRQFNDSAMMLASMLVILVIGWSIDKFVFGTLERKIRVRWGLEK